MVDASKTPPFRSLCLARLDFSASAAPRTRPFGAQTAGPHRGAEKSSTPQAAGHRTWRSITRRFQFVPRGFGRRAKNSVFWAKPKRLCEFLASPPSQTKLSRSALVSARSEGPDLAWPRFGPSRGARDQIWHAPDSVRAPQSRRLSLRPSNWARRWDWSLCH